MQTQQKIFENLAQNEYGHPVTSRHCNGARALAQWDDLCTTQRRLRIW